MNPFRILGWVMFIVMLPLTIVIFLCAWSYASAVALMEKFSDAC